ncbi:MAG: hypothetical protein HOL16_01985 [Alphaproteobacteria bacterium]|nr:hypothetical protein [Alphaproteobacteria bacterium]
MANPRVVFAFSIEEVDEMEGFLHKAQTTLNADNFVDKDSVFVGIESSFSQLRSLALDGGGVLGVFEAEIIEEIEHQTGKKIHQLFRGGITGVSTGSFMALAAVCPDNASEERMIDHKVFEERDSDTGDDKGNFVRYYEEMGGKVFKKWTARNCAGNMSACFMPERSKASNCFFGLLNTLTCCGCFACNTNCNGYMGVKYSRTTLNRIVEEDFGHAKLQDALAPVQVVSYNLTKQTPEYATSIPGSNDKWLVRSMAQAGLASSAAPTFFRAYKIDEEYHIDGGVIENSPVMSSYAFAKRLSGGRQINFNDFSHVYMMVSIGTGDAIYSNWNHLRRAGKLPWAAKVPDITISGPRLIAAEQLSHILGDENYYRITAPIYDDKVAEMDNPANIVPQDPR